MSDLKILLMECISGLNINKESLDDTYEIILSNVLSNSKYYNIDSTGEIYDFFKKKPFYSRRLICAIALANERGKNTHDIIWNRRRELMLVFKKQI